MSDPPTPASVAESLPGSPFQRLRALLAGTGPGAEPIDLSIGAPRHRFPAIVGETLMAALDGFNRYPPAHGDTDFGRAAAAWLERRFGLARPLDPARHLLPLAGSREGLFTVAFVVAADARARGIADPVMLFPNPFYPVYAGAAVAAGLRPVALPATAATGDLPDLDALSADLLDRTAAFYICSPANPQGSIADADYLGRLVDLGHTHGFIAVSDECYSELYRSDPPPSLLSAARDAGFSRILAFNSLSKRSNVPGLRAGLVAGDADLIEKFFALRNVVAATVPLPVQAVAAALYRDEDHVEENRRLYNEKFAAAARILGDRYGHVTPEGGFFLWLDVTAHGGDEAAARRLWSEAGVKVVPGGYLAIRDESGVNPGEGYLRLALVGETGEIAQALERVVGVLG